MKKANILSMSFLSAVMLAAANDAHAQSSNNNALVFNNNSDAKDTAETVDAKKGFVVMEGVNTDAYLASKNGNLAIHVYGGNDGAMSAEKYAKILANSFADRTYTDKPMYITVTHQEMNADGHSRAAIYMDAVRFVFNKADSFTPEQIGGAIQIISDEFVKEHGSHLIIPEDITPAIVAGLN